MLSSLLGIARQWSREKFAILTLEPRSHIKPRSHDRISKYRTWAIASESDTAPDVYLER